MYCIFVVKIAFVFGLKCTLQPPAGLILDFWTKPRIIFRNWNRAPTKSREGVKKIVKRSESGCRRS